MDMLENCELVFRIATLYDNGNKNANKLRVRVLPDMQGWDEEDLPWYPIFNATQDFHGVAEKDSESESFCTQYWVACTKDYKTGYILAEANCQSGNTAEKAATHWGFDTFRTHMSRCGLDVSRVNYKELKVLYSNKRYFDCFDKANMKGGDGWGAAKTSTVLICTNVRTGDVWIFQGAGNVVCIGQKEFLLRYGSPDQMHSFIEMNSEKIYLKAKNIVLDAEHTSLGKHGGKLLLTFGMVPFAVDGIACIPAPDITG